MSGPKNLGRSPGLKLQAYLALPKGQDGAASLTVKSKRTPISANGRLESLSPFVRGLVSIQTNSHTPFAEQTSFTALVSNQNEEYYAVSYNQMLGNSGLVLNIDTSIYDGQSGEDTPSGIKRDVTSLRLSTTLSYPVIVDNQQSLIASVGFNAVNFDDRIRDSNSFRGITSKTNSRAIVVGAKYNNVSENQFRSVQLNLSKGINSLGASKSAKANFDSQLNFINQADLDFNKVNLNILQSLVLPKNFKALLSMASQYSRDNLPVAERIQFGGFQYGRAFRPGLLFGDSGWGASAELSRVYPFSYKLSKLVNIIGLEPYVLVDAAKTYQNIRITDDNMTRSLATGLRLKTDAIGVVDIALAKSLINRVSEDENDLTFSFNFNFLLN